MADNNQKQTVEPGKARIAAVYAKALLGAANKAGNTESLLDELASLLNDVFPEVPKLQQVLSSVRVTHEEKVALLDKAFAGKMSPQLLNFLKVVSSHGRLDCLSQIEHASRRLYNQQRGVKEIRVTTAEELTPDMQEELRGQLSNRFGGEVELQTAVDASLIGGMVIRVGDTVYDGSILNRLNRLRTGAVQKATQEIRHSLERFESAQ